MIDITNEFIRKPKAYVHMYKYSCQTKTPKKEWRIVVWTKGEMFTFINQYYIYPGNSQEILVGNELVTNKVKQLKKELENMFAENYDKALALCRKIKAKNKRKRKKKVVFIKN